MEISVIVPALNEEKYIEDCLKSILNQTFPRKRYEIIVSDGASTDNTGKIAKRYADRVVVSKKRGIWWGRNYGAKFAKGKYLVFIDADTVLDKDYLETVYPYLEKGYVGVSTCFNFSGKSASIRIANCISYYYWIFSDIIGKTGLFGFNMCMPNRTFIKTGGFKNLDLEDVRIYKDLSKEGKINRIWKKKVTTSSRRLEKFGLLGALRYYSELYVLESKNSKGRIRTSLSKYGKYIKV
ncbi:MAG: glycosyltransferase [Candidatus Aenigmatarchaeota archaeon]